jgi:hypothetical protein
LAVARAEDVRRPQEVPRGIDRSQSSVGVMHTTPLGINLDGDQAGKIRIDQKYFIKAICYR